MWLCAILVVLLFMLGMFSTISSQVPSTRWPAEVVVPEKPRRSSETYVSGADATITYNIRMKLDTGETINVKRRFRGKLSELECNIRHTMLLDD